MSKCSGPGVVSAVARIAAAASTAHTAERARMTDRADQGGRAQRIQHREHPARLGHAGNGEVRIRPRPGRAADRGGEKGRHLEEGGHDEKHAASPQHLARDACGRPALHAPGLGGERQAGPHQQEEPRRAEVRDEARQERHRARVACPGAGPHLLRVEAPDHEAGVVQRHHHHQQAAEQIDGRQPLRPRIRTPPAPLWPSAPA